MGVGLETEGDLNTRIKNAIFALLAACLWGAASSQVAVAQKDDWVLS